MKKDNFRNLLTDLYNIYNPASLIYVDDLVEKYSRLEFDSLKNIFIKYNRKTSPYYNPEFDTDKYAISLIREYEGGSRSLQNVNLKEQYQEKVENLEQKSKEEDIKKIETLQKEVAGEVDKKIQTIEKSFDEKEQSFKTSLEKIYKDFEEKLTALRESTDDVTIRIFNTNSNSELELPNKKIIAGLGKGSRLILRDEEGKMIGMEIVDVTYDGVSDINGKPLVEVYLEKA